MNKSLPIIATLGLTSFVGVAIAQEVAPPTKKDAAIIKKALKPAKSDRSRAKGVARKWAHELSDIKPDANTIYGKLDNGMRYIIHKNALPPGRVSLRLHVDAGSLSEKESQRGLAHFLEHMVFNGTDTFPNADTLVPELQRLGIAFGANANAYTSFDETVYMMDLPNIKKETVDLGFNVMGDFADGAHLTDEEIEEERGVISAEKTSTDSVNFRMMEKQFTQLLPNSLLPKRFPIGIDEVIDNAPRSEFVDFYTNHYTPEKMTFIVVGDIDVEEMKKRIMDTFAGMKNPAKKAPDATIGDASLAKGLNAHVFADKELTSTSVSLMTVKKKEKQIDTTENRAEGIPLAIANSIINRRFSRLAKQEGSVITSGSTSNSVLFREAEIGSIEVNAKDGNWQAALPVMEQELRRAIKHGFTKAEFDEVVTNLINSYEQTILSAPTRKTPAIASDFAKHVHGDFVYSTPEEDLKILKANLAKITPETCHKALQASWDTPDLALVLSTKEKPEGAEKSLVSLYKRSQIVNVDPVEEKEVTTFAYTDFGKAGKVVSQKKIDDLGIHQIVFENGVKVNYKKTDFSKNSINMVATFGDGLINKPKVHGIEMLANVVMNGGGLGKHSVDDLRSLLAGKNVGVSFGIGEESFTLSGGCTPEDLELQLQLLCASLTDPGYRAEAERQFKAGLPMLFAQLKHSTAGAGAQLNSWMHGGDYRFEAPNEEKLKAVSTSDVKTWLAPYFEKAELELGLVGDIDEAKLIPLLAKTVGALPKRSMKAVIKDEARVINVPKAPVTQSFYYDTKVDKAIVLIRWKAEDNTQKDSKLAKQAQMLGKIVSDRMRIKLREELGEAYSPGANTSLSSTYKNVGFVTAYSPVKTKDIESVSKAIIKIGNEIATNGATEDELKRAHTPMIGQLKKEKRDNGYWLGIVANAQTKPYVLDRARNRDKEYAEVTLEQVNALAKKYLTPERAIQMPIIPKQAEPAKEDK